MTAARMFAALRRVPFTLLLGTAILVVAIRNGSARAELIPFIAQAWGFDPLHFKATQTYRLVTGTLVVRDPLMLGGLLLFLAPSVGIYEARRGTLRAVVLFVASHIATLFLTTALVVYPLHLAGATVQSDWAPAGDVGASFGAFGCLGAWMQRQTPRRRARWIGFTVLALAAKLILLPERFGDIGHIIAFFAGMGLDRVLFGSPTSPEPPAGRNSAPRPGA